MTWKKLIALSIFCLAVAGCQTTEDLIKEDDMVCRSYGLEVGSSQYIQCREVQQADRTIRYQAYEQRRSVENIASSITNAVQSNAKNREQRKRCTMSAPDKDGWSRQVCSYY